MTLVIRDNVLDHVWKESVANDYTPSKYTTCNKVVSTPGRPRRNVFAGPFPFASALVKYFVGGACNKITGFTELYNTFTRLSK